MNEISEVCSIYSSVTAISIGETCRKRYREGKHYVIVKFPEDKEHRTAKVPDFNFK